MELSQLLPFMLVSFGLIAIPGPNVLVIVSTSIQYGRRRGLQTVAGTSLAMLLQLVIVGAGTTSFVLLLAQGLVILKWLGVAYLLYLGFRHLRQALSSATERPAISATATFARGFSVSLLNPKTLFFFSAFLPQFVSSSDNYAVEISVLSAIFLSMAIVLDSCYALFTVKLKSVFENRLGQRIGNGITGLLYSVAGTWLAMSRRA